MKTLAYYIIGAVIGVILAFLFWWSFPDALQADRSENTPPDAVQISEVQTLNTAITDSRQNAITKAVKEVSPAVVGINVISIREYRTRNPFFDDPFFRGMFPERVWRQKVENLGSGFLIAPNGYIFTNEHVVHQATQIIVTMTNAEKYEAEIIGFDYDSDVALLKIKGKNFPYIPFGDSDDILIGEWAIALGNPFGLFAIHSQPSVTVGVISAIDRDFDRNRDGKLYKDMVQTDASINRGNSGGPLVNSMGRLIGMNTMIFTESGGGSIGLGFAIPSNKLRNLYNELKERGSLDRDFWTGLLFQNVNRLIAMSLRLPEISGVIVTEIEKGSPADKAGLEATDVIITVNDRKINSSNDIQSIFRNSDLRVGDEVKLGVIRGGKTEMVMIRLEKKK
ncbi:MAG: trypsin-like peptidase domain-containing protein [Candidatus Hatepunaea meridiana]|nr:trypsin-like peptidase domain-containing protein [Candidatus Hatepunaea meridiana]